MITISHTHQDGTTLEGSVKGDGVFDIVRRPENGGFQWRRDPGIHIRGSRDKDAQEARILAAAQALRDEGHQVEIEIDNEWRPAAEREADRTDRVAARVDRLEDRSAAAGARSDAAHERARAIGDNIPFGQPVLVGHHSERGHRRDIARMDAGMRRSLDESQRAGHLADRARGAERNERHKHNPGAMARRIETLEAAVRRNLRELDEAKAVEASDSYLERLQRSIDRDTEEIRHLQGKITALAESGEYDPWTREHLQKGDKVAAGGMWLPVRRLNAKTVSVPDPMIYERYPDTTYTQTVPYRELGGRRRDGMQLDRPQGEPWPVEQADKVAKWRYLLHASTLPCNAYTDKESSVRYAQRLVHGLDIAAADAEVEAFQPDKGDVHARRALAIAYLDVHDRLVAGEKVPDIAASIEPVGEPAWRLPDTEPECCHPQDLPAGCLVVGVYDHGPGGYKPRPGLTGPLADVSPVKDRNEGGVWVTITLTTGAEYPIETHRWVAYHPAGDAQRNDSDT